MGAEVFWDTSGFFALPNTDDPAQAKARQLAASALAERRRNVTSDWVIGECCTLLIARRKPHLVNRFLDHAERGADLFVVPGEVTLMNKTKVSSAGTSTMLIRSWIARALSSWQSAAFWRRLQPTNTSRKLGS